MENNVLHLVLTHYWFDKVESGEKPEEYREETPYWEKRLSKPFTHVCFHRGYSNRTIYFKAGKLRKGKPKAGLAPAEWLQKTVFIIPLISNYA